MDVTPNASTKAATKPFYQSISHSAYNTIRRHNTTLTRKTKNLWLSARLRWLFAHHTADDAASWSSLVRSNAALVYALAQRRLWLKSDVTVRRQTLRHEASSLSLPHTEHHPDWRQDSARRETRRNFLWQTHF